MEADPAEFDVASVVALDGEVVEDEVDGERVDEVDGVEDWTVFVLEPQQHGGFVVVVDVSWLLDDDFSVAAGVFVDASVAEGNVGSGQVASVPVQEWDDSAVVVVLVVVDDSEDDDGVDEGGNSVKVVYTETVEAKSSVTVIVFSKVIIAVVNLV